MKKKFEKLDSGVRDFISADNHSDSFQSVEKPKRGRPKLVENGQEINRDEKFTLYLSSDEMSKIDIMARISGKSKNRWIIDTINESLSRPECVKAISTLLEVQKQI